MKSPEVSHDEPTNSENLIQNFELFDVQSTEMYRKIEKKRSFLTDQIEEYEKLIMEQKKQIEELKERKETLKYNLETKEKVKNHISNIYGLIFERTKIPIIIHGENATVLTWNRSGAEHCGYKFEDLHTKVNYATQLIREKCLIDGTFDHFEKQRDTKGRSFLFPTVSKVHGVPMKVLSIVEIYDEFTISITVGTQMITLDSSPKQ
eukprot:gene8735-683_t